MTTPILFERDGAIARVTLNSPETGNGMDQPFCDRLLEIVHECEDDDRIRVVLLTANGRFFCVGGNVNAFAAASDEIGKFVRNLTASLHMAIARLAALSKPVVTAVNGSAAGAGLGLAVIGDVVLAADSAKFTLAYPGIGLSPDAGATFILPRLIGLRRTQEMLYLGESIAADEAARIGLISRSAPAANLLEDAEKVVQRLAKMPTRTLARSKKLLLLQGARSLEQQLEHEAVEIVKCATEPNAKEGIAAFLENREAAFH